MSLKTRLTNVEEQLAPKPYPYTISVTFAEGSETGADDHGTAVRVYIIDDDGTRRELKKSST